MLIGKCSGNLKHLPRVVIPLAVAFCLMTAATDGVELKGRLTSSFYGYEESGDQHLRPYLGLQSTLTAWRGQQTGLLTFHNYLRWRTDWSSKLASDPQTFVYDAYFRLKDIPRGTSIYFGRQFVYNAVGSALMDGARIKYRRGRIDVQLFGGSRASRLHPDKVRSMSDNGVFGGRLAYRLRSNMRLGLNWILTRSYGSVASHRAGLDFEKTLREARLYGRATYDLAGLQVDDFLLRATYRPKDWYLAGEFGIRRPAVASNSIFSLIDAARRQEVRLDLHRTIWRQFTLITRARVSFLGDDKVTTTSLGVRTGEYYLAWRQQTDDGGDRNGLTGFVNYRFADQWEVYSSADMSRYRVQPEQVERSDAYSATIGTRWRGQNGLAASVEGQYLRNAVATEDYRVLLRFSKNFSIGQKTGW